VIVTWPILLVLLPHGNIYATHLLPMSLLPTGKKMREYNTRFIAMGRKPGSSKDWLPQTPFQEWLDAALFSRGWDLKGVAAEVGIDYSNLWRVARGNPKSYPERSRLSYESTVALGRALGDIDGALKAAGFASASAQGAMEVTATLTASVGIEQIQRSPTDDAEFWDAYEGAPQEDRDLAKQLLQRARDRERARTIGGTTAE
jgi:hypothetical protein